MKLVVGLGNPGPKYSQTRHNAGRLAVEHAAQSWGVSFKKEKSLDASVALLNREGTEMILAYPETFMNLSGTPVSRLANHFQANPETDLLIVVDDMALPFGRLRLRPGGSAGGHNGLRSIEQVLATQTYARLRIGIGSPSSSLKEAGEENEAVRDYALSLFDSREQQLLPAVWQSAAKALRLWANQPIVSAMNIVNPEPEANGRTPE